MQSPLQQMPTSSEPFSLSCSAVGFPSPISITWFHNGTLIESNVDVNITTQIVDVYTTRSTLLVTLAQSIDSGDYYCVAQSQRQVYSNVISETAQISVLSKFK